MKGGVETKGVVGVCGAADTNKAYISQMPEFRREALADLTASLVEQVFSAPDAEERYQEWLAKRRQKERS